MSQESQPARRAVDYEQVDEAYLEKRQLQRGAAGWVLLAGLGVAYVISGDFAGWNFGLAEGGWGGLLIATILMATMYTCMVFGLAELSSALPDLRRRLHVRAPCARPARAASPPARRSSSSTRSPRPRSPPSSAATSSRSGCSGSPTAGRSTWSSTSLFVGIHLYGVGEALKLTFVITAIAAVALVVFVIGMIPKFDAANLHEHRADGRRRALASFLPFGYVGIWAALPVRDLVLPRHRGRAARGRGDARPQARPAARHHRRHGRAARLRRARADLRPGRRRLGRRSQDSDNPLVAGASRGRWPTTARRRVSQFVNYVGLLGLIASFFSIIYAYSRQTFALSRAGYLPASCR